MAYETFKILIVDDDPSVLTAFRWLLQKYHYEIVEASDGEQGLRKAFGESPDVVLLDLMMPEMDGYEVCRRLRAAPSTQDLPIIVLTALSGTEARERVREMGADDYMTKTESAEMLDGRIKMLFKQRLLVHTRSWLADLPGSAEVDRVLRGRLAVRAPLGICYLDLDGLATFNATAGYGEGDHVLWRLARILLDRVGEENQGDLVGYCGLDDFVLITSPDRAESLASSILESYSRVSQGVLPRLSIGIVLIQDAQMLSKQQNGRLGGVFSNQVSTGTRGKSIHPGQVSGLGLSLLREAKAGQDASVRIAHLAL